jgi:hypothetical protein
MSDPKTSRSAPTFRQALEACRSFLADPEGGFGVTISDTVWVSDTMTLLDMVEAALNNFDSRVGETLVDWDE